MRTFNNESVWDKENQEWVEIYYIDGQEVDVDTYTEQLAVEELATEDEDIVDESCKCCNCADNEYCVDFNCTCGEVEDDCEDEVLEEEMCFCRECQQEREQKLITECLDMVFDPDACVNCTIDKVIEVLYRFKELGYLEARDDMRDFLED